MSLPFLRHNDELDVLSLVPEKQVSEISPLISGVGVESRQPGGTWKTPFTEDTLCPVLTCGISPCLAEQTFTQDVLILGTTSGAYKITGSQI